MAKVERYGLGEEAKEFVPGDLIHSHRHNLCGGLISWAQKRRFRGADAVFAHWSHCAMIVEKDGALVEAEVTGVRQNPISRYHANENHLVRLGRSAGGRSVAGPGSRANPAGRPRQAVRRATLNPWRPWSKGRRFKSS